MERPRELELDVSLPRWLDRQLSGMRRGGSASVPGSFVEHFSRSLVGNP
ncbi:MAG: hypothetical protein ACK5N0_06800 [Synechococcaceae cyanobacterium]